MFLYSLFHFLNQANDNSPNFLLVLYILDLHVSGIIVRLLHFFVNVFQQFGQLVFAVVNVTAKQIHTSRKPPW